MQGFRTQAASGRVVSDDPQSDGRRGAIPDATAPADTSSHPRKTRKICQALRRRHAASLENGASSLRDHGELENTPSTSFREVLIETLDDARRPAHRHARIILLDQVFDKRMWQRLLVSNEIFKMPDQLVEWLASVEVSDLRGTVVNYLRSDQRAINRSASRAKSFGHVAAHVGR